MKRTIAVIFAALTLSACGGHTYDACRTRPGYNDYSEAYRQACGEQEWKASQYRERHAEEHEAEEAQAQEEHER